MPAKLNTCIKALAAEARGGHGEGAGEAAQIEEEAAGQAAKLSSRAHGHLSLAHSK